MNRPGELDPKLRAVLVYLCRRSGGLTTTLAVKLPYLVDVVALRVLGRRITRAKYETWDYGVVATEVWRAIKNDQLGKAFEVAPHKYSESGKMIQCAKAEPSDLSADEVAVVECVAEIYANLSALEIGLVTKRLNTEISFWGSNKQPRMDEEAFDRLSSGWQGMWETLSFTNLADKKLWGEPIKDAREHLRRSLV